MSCKRHRDALRDVAAGAAVTAVVEAHLASCAGCRVELAALRQALAVADDEMARLLRVDPSPGLVVRIRHAAAESGETGAGWRPGFVLTTAAAAVILASVFLAQRAPRPAAPATVVDRAPAREVPPAPPAPETVAPGTRLSQSVDSRSHAPAPSRKEPARQPEVLVQQEEAEALVRLAAHLRRRSVAPESLLVADLSAPLAEPKVGEIQPIEIVSLDAAEDGGVERKGDHS